MSRPPRRQPNPGRFDALMRGASAGCTAFLVGCLVAGIALVAWQMR